MKKFYLVAAIIAVMMMFVGCDTEQNGRDGKDGISIVWKGSLAAAPGNPETNWAYYNTADRKSYIYDGTNWQILAQDGADGNDGQDATSDVWTIGDDGYWYLNGTKTEYKSKGEDGDNTNIWTIGDDGYWYLNGTKTEYKSKGEDGQDGQDGHDGQDGSDGISIVWKGSLAAAPNNPETDWAYYNTADKKSYIFDGSAWQILAQDGQDVTPDVHIPSYTIIFSANGGTGYMPKMVCEIGQTYDVPECGFTAPAKMGFKFWDLFGIEETFTDLSTSDGDIIVVTAQWGQDYTAANGNIVINNKEYAKTSMKQVLSETTAITCDQSGGVFPTARGSVTLSPYSIGKYEVTQQLYTAVMGSNPSYFTASQKALDDGETDALLRPVDYVSWYDAIVFCNKLSVMMGKTRCYKLSDGTYPEDAETIPGYSEPMPTDIATLWDATCDWTANGYRLPTECEWECAARGGSYSTGTPWTYTYSGSNTFDDVAWYVSNSKQHTWEVGLKQANTLGLYDMSGNVTEWCWDNYNTAEIDSSTPVTGPETNSSSDFYRRLRSGCYNFNASNWTMSGRGMNLSPSSRVIDIGFRLACSGE